MYGENANGFPTSQSGQQGTGTGTGFNPTYETAGVSGIADLEYAASESGSKQYLEDIYTNALSKAKDAAFAYDTVVNKLRDGWVGQAEKQFEIELYGAAQQIADKLDLAKASIESEVDSVVTTMKEQDAKYADESLKFEIK